MRSLIIGASGLVGSALKRRLPTALEGIHKEIDKRKDKNKVHIDLTKYETIFRVFSDYRPSIVYLPAAIAHVDKCEGIGTNHVNVLGSTTVLRLCEQFECKLVFFSSSYVFDGKSDVPYITNAEKNPINNYGVQKSAVEDLILKSEAKFVIVRTVGVFGVEKAKKNFAKQVISTIFAGRKIYVPNDQYMNPIISDDLARITIQLAEKENGLFHVAGDTSLTKYDFAVKIAKYFGLEGNVVGVSSEEMKQVAARPKMGSLDCSYLPKIGIPIPSLDSALVSFLALEYNG